MRRANLTLFRCCVLGVINLYSQTVKRADVLHKMFYKLLAPHQLNINENTSLLIVLQMVATCNQLIKEKQDDKERMNKQLADANKKIVKLEERYIN